MSFLIFFIYIKVQKYRTGYLAYSILLLSRALHHYVIGFPLIHIKRFAFFPDAYALPAYVSRET